MESVGPGQDIEEGVEQPAEGDRIESETTERRGRRRRRGRGRGRDLVRDEENVEEAGSLESDEHDFDGIEDDRAVDAETSEDHDFDGEEDQDSDGDEEHDGEHEHEDDEDGGESPRIGFRNIPTWQDAIGMMIAKNMESRTRNPGGGPAARVAGSSRGRGRGRGRRAVIAV